MNKNVVKTIKHKMIDLDMTITEFAKHCNLSYSLFNRLLNNKLPFGLKAQINIQKIIPELTEQDFEEHNKMLKNA